MILIFFLFMPGIFLTGLIRFPLLLSRKGFTLFLPVSFRFVSILDFFVSVPSFSLRFTGSALPLFRRRFRRFPRIGNFFFSVPFFPITSDKLFFFELCLGHAAQHALCTAVDAVRVNVVVDGTVLCVALDRSLVHSADTREC